jgi:hypothetical protein
MISASLSSFLPSSPVAAACVPVQPSRFGFGPEHVVTFPTPLQEPFYLFSYDKFSLNLRNAYRQSHRLLLQ